MVDNVQVKFGANTSALDGDLNKLTGEFRTVFQSAESGARSMSSSVQSSMNKMQKEVKETRNQFELMGASIQSAARRVAAFGVVLGIGQVARSVVGTITEFERLRAVLTTLEGDAAATRFEHLKKFAAETPFDLQQVVTAFAKLKAQGLDPSNEAMRAYGNVAAGMSKSLDQMIEAATDATVGEMERLKEFGIKAQQQGDKVTFIFKGVATTVSRDGESIQKYLQNIGNTDFAGAMARQMATLQGSFSNLGDTVATLADDIGRGGLSAAISEVVSDMTSAGSGAHQFAEDLGKGLGTVVISVWEIVKGFGEALGQIFAAITDVIAAFVGSSASDLDIWGGLFRTALVVINGFGVGVRVIMNGIAFVVRSVTDTFVTFGKIVAQVFSMDFSGALASYQAWGTRLSNAAKTTAGNMVNALVEGKQRQDALLSRKGEQGPSVALPGYVAPAKMNLGKGAGGSDKSGAAAAKKAAREAAQAEIDAIDMRMEAARDSLAEQLRIEDEKLAALKRLYGEDSREYRQGLREKARLTREFEQETVRLAQDRVNHLFKLSQIEVDSQETVERTKLDQQRSAIQTAFDLGQINANQKQEALSIALQQELRIEEEHEANVYSIKSQALREQIALDNLREPEKKKLLADLELLEAEHSNRVVEMAANRQAKIAEFHGQAAREAQQQWQQALQPIGQGFAGIINGMLARTQSFSQGMIQMMDQLVAQMVNQFVNMAVQWAAAELSKTNATQTGAAVRQATEVSASAAGATASAANATAQIGTNAAVGASGAFASIASIPVVGPFLAPAAAAAAMAAIMGFARLVSARGGYDIPSGSNPLVQAHEEEMILPAAIANPLRSMLAGAGPRRSGLAQSAATAGAEARSIQQSQRDGDVTFNYQPSHTNQDTNMDNLLRRDGARLRKWLGNEMRNGNLKLASGRS